MTATTTTKTTRSATTRTRTPKAPAATPAPAPVEPVEQTWTTDEMQAEFTVIGFALGCCVVRRKSDDVRGTLEFRRDESDGRRRYYGFVEV